MNYEILKRKIVEWVLDNIVPNAYPDGVSRWLVGFGVGRKLSNKIDAVKDIFPTTPEGDIDVCVLRDMVSDAFRVQPTVPVKLERIITDLETLKSVEPTVTINEEDANSLIKYVMGTVTEKEITL